MNSPLFSIVVPVYNEQENISELSRRLVSVLDSMCTVDQPSAAYEIIYVDDGSTDQSWAIIQSLHAQEPRIKGIRFSRNFGHHSAITAGLDCAKGEMIVLMDGDLQDRPEEIPILYARMREGYDLVYGIRKEKKDSVLKRLTSYSFWWMINAFSDISIPRNQTLLRIFNRRILEIMKSMRERARFVHGMIAWTGFRVALQEVEHSPRLHGTSKYNFGRLFRLAFHAITSFSTVPLRLSTYLGLVSAGIGFCYGCYFLYKKLFLGIPVLGYASIIVAVLFMGGVQLLILGIMGEYLGRVYLEVQARPIYILRETLLD